MQFCYVLLLFRGLLGCCACIACCVLVVDFYDVCLSCVLVCAADLCFVCVDACLVVQAWGVVVVRCFVSVCMWFDAVLMLCVCALMCCALFVVALRCVVSRVVLIAVGWFDVLRFDVLLFLAALMCFRAD